MLNRSASEPWTLISRGLGDARAERRCGEETKGSLFHILTSR
jgi:hypothetical protein